MALISKAGRAWLGRHGVSLTGVDLASIAVGRYGRYVSFAREPHRPKQRGFYRDILLEREGRWLLQTEIGSGMYREHRNGRAVLMVRNLALPETVLTALYRSNTALQRVVDLPEDSVILAGAPKIIRGDLKRNATRLLLRVEREYLPAQERRPRPGEST